MTYRPDIDGLRCIAVMMVILFHAEFTWIVGGYVGVDIFFVISGYLISYGLITSKDHSLGRFYSRRIRRLFPSLLATVAVTAVAALLIMNSVDFKRAGLDSIFAIFSLSNIGFWLESGYWDVESKYKPLLHTWSLSVEEQFYLLWPALTWLSLRFGRTFWTLVILFIMLGGLLLSQLYVATDSAAVFYLTPFRMYQFGIGTILAILTVQSKRAALIQSAPLKYVAFTLGLILIFVPAYLYDGSDKYIGALASVPCFGTIFIIASGQPRGLSVLLSNRVSVFTGRISYSLYLVHWPVFALYSYIVLRETTLLEKAVLIAMTFGLAITLYYVVEKRFRYEVIRGERKPLSKTGFNLASLGIAISLSALIGLTTIYYPFDRSTAKTSISELLDRTQIDENNRRQSLLPNRCSIDRNQCLYAEKDKKNILIIGDSHALDGYNIFTLLYPDENVILSPDKNNKLLNYVEGSVRETSEGRMPEGPTIFDNKSLLRDMDAIVFSGLMRSDLMPKLKDTIQYLQTQSSAKIIVLEQSPRFINNLPAIIRRDGLDLSNRIIPEDQIYTDWREVNAQMRQVAEDTGVLFIEKASYFCPEGKCLIAIGPAPQSLSSYDKHHLSLEAATGYSEYLRTTNLALRIGLGSFGNPTVIAAESDFTSLEPEDWVVQNGQAIRTQDGMRLVLQPGGSASAFNRKIAVEAGQTYQVNLTIEVEEPMAVVLRIVSYCSPTDPEKAVAVVRLPSGRSSHQLNHTFEHDHDCARFVLGAGRFARDLLLEDISFIRLNAETLETSPP